jgi:hypothetical protein
VNSYEVVLKVKASFYFLGNVMIGKINFLWGELGGLWGEEGECKEYGKIFLIINR